MNDGVDNIFNKINEMLRERDFAGLDDVLTMRDNLFIVIADAIKNQIKRLKEEQTSTKASMLYLNILNETKTMVLQSRNLIKSQAYFLSQMKSADNGAAENSGVTAQEAQDWQKVDKRICHEWEFVTEFSRGGFLCRDKHLLMIVGFIFDWEWIHYPVGLINVKSQNYFVV